ncbi:hydrolase [Caballeronia choica]|uniref:Hydrolase n=1 Tax=Caballeronia choica TaxID=326476 RepID=A0A158K267_9BURK|nr:amidohydrolase family protein [Caballeronia choica]SAL75222.1 hydrolase [Caballeronia choica]
MAIQPEHKAAPGPITAIDTHAHVFERGLPLATRRRYAPRYDAPLPDYLAQLDAHGISHGVLVQPSFLGTDCRYLLRALALAPERLRGVAVIDPACPPTCNPAHLDAMHRAGVVGIRLNLFDAPDPRFDDPVWHATLGHLGRLGWHVEVHVEAKRLAGIVEPLLEHEVRIVVDHFGRPDPALGVEDPGFRYLLSLGRTGRVWVKISGAYRNGVEAVATAFARVAADALKHEFGVERLVWGSDWPHTQFEQTERFERALRVLDAVVRDERERRAVLVSTPARLFNFGQGSTPP